MKPMVIIQAIALALLAIIGAQVSSQTETPRCTVTESTDASCTL